MVGDVDQWHRGQSCTAIICLGAPNMQFMKTTFEHWLR